MANGVDHLVENIQRSQQPLDNVRPLTCLLQLILGTAPDDLLAVLDKELEHALEAEQAGLPIDQRQQLHTKGLLQRRVFVEISQHVLWLDHARQLDHDTHAGTIAFIAADR